MLSLLKSRHSLPSKCHRTGLSSFHCSTRIGDATSSFLGCAVPKETKLSEGSNLVHQLDSAIVTDEVGQSQPENLSESATDTLPRNHTVEKAKKKKTKSKKRSEKIELNVGSTADDVSATEFNPTTSQSSVVTTDESGGAGKRSKKIRHEGQVVRSEDVDGYCGSLPVDDLIEFIDCGRKLWQSRSQRYPGSLMEVENLQSVKKESVRDAVVENDSGFGDVEVSDRTDASHSDGALSPSVSSISESVEIVVELLSDSLNPADSQSTETKEVNMIAAVCETPDVATPEWTLGNELSFAGAFLSDEELGQPEPEFIVVRQKKRRAKSQKMSFKDTVCADKTRCHLVGPVPSQSSSMVSSSASSERSNSPQSVANVNELTVNGHIGRRTSDTQDSRTNMSSYRRFNSEPKWRARHPHFHPLPYTSNELRPVNTQARASGIPSARRGKYVPFMASSQTRDVEKMKGRKYDLPVGIPQVSQLPDVVTSAERLRQADKPCLTSAAKVIMQDAHCQTVDDAVLPSPDPDSSTDTSYTRVPFDLLTLQLFMYQAFEDVMNTSKSSSHGIQFYSSLEVTSDAGAVH